jgi:hypothetical protein
MEPIWRESKRVVRVDIGSRFRSGCAPGEPSIHGDVQTLTRPECELEPKGRSIEVAPAQGKIIERTVQHGAASVGAHVATAQPHLDPRPLEEEALPTALSGGRGGEKRRSGGEHGEQEYRRSHSTQVTDQKAPPRFMPCSTLATGVISARGMPNPEGMFSAG